MLKFIYIFTLLFLVSCTKEEVHIYSKEKDSNNYRNYNPYQNPYNYNPYSRGYKNPYEFYQRNQNYPSYYDQDYYYVPPSRYKNNERDDNSFNSINVK